MPKYFRDDEFACKCGCGKNDISPELVEKLELAQKESRLPFIITSGCRCEKHNAAVGGVAGSAHIKGLAVDIAVELMDQHIMVNVLHKHFKRMGIGKNFIHVDIDKSKPNFTWNYR